MTVEKKKRKFSCLEDVVAEQPTLGWHESCLVVTSSVKEFKTY